MQINTQENKSIRFVPEDDLEKFIQAGVKKTGLARATFVQFALNSLRIGEPFTLNTQTKQA